MSMSHVYRVDARDFLNNKKKIVIALDDLDKHTVHSGKQVSLLSKQVAASGREGVNAFSALSKAALAFFGASLTLGGITGLLGGMSRTLTQLGNQSAYLAIPARRLDGLSRAAEAAGSSTGALMTQLKTCAIHRHGYVPVLRMSMTIRWRYHSYRASPG
ncbi:hypothetical protein SODG_005945 [Sodalis praecaptivus]